jgi:hypothetical protein
MAESWLHEKDTEIAIQGTTSRENIELIIKVVYLVIDGTYKTANSTKGFETFDYLLEHLKIYGITEDSLYNDLITQGVDSNLINNRQFYNGKIDFLQKWLLPSGIGDNKHQFTHKGADYVYDKKEEDGDYWSGKEKHQSWMVKRKLLQDTIKNIYSVSPSDAEKIAMTLYSIHCLRDLHCANVDDPRRREYLFDLPDGIKKYTLPLIKNNDLLKKITESNDKLIKSIDISKKSNKWDENLGIILDDLLGAVESDGGGLLSKVIPEFLSSKI